MTPEERQALLFELMERAVNDFESLNKQHIIFMLREIDRIRNELTDRLLEYADSEGTVKKNRIQQILRELDEIEEMLQETTLEGIQKVISESAQAAVEGNTAALAQSLGNAAIEGIAFDSISQDVLVYLSTSFSPDGLVLSDRIWQLTGEQRDALNSVIRSGILQGVGVTNMVAQVRRIFETDTWKIRRLVITEGNTAYRVATSFAARRSDIPMMLKIVDHPGHENHQSHRCYILARQDRYGKGAGVYKPTDTEIFNPHPNCTATLRYVIDEEWMRQRYGEQSQQLVGKSKEPEAPQENGISPDADPIATLGSIKSKKEAAEWAKRNIGEHKDYDFKDYDLGNMIDMNRAMLVMKQRYPEMMERITYVGTIQEINRRKYEENIERLIQHNIKNAYWSQRVKDVGEEQARKELRDAIVRRGFVKREKVSPNTNAQAGIFPNADGSRETYVALNKTRSKDSEEFQRIKEYNADLKWSAIGSRYGSMIHEFGHQIDYMLSEAGLATFADDLWNKYRTRPMTWWHRNISEYGSTQRAEMFAELFSEYIIKGDNAGTIAKQFGEKLEEAMTKYRARGNV